MNINDGNKLADQLLVEKVLRGNTGEFAIIIKDTERLVNQLVFKMVPIAEDRKDLVQDIYMNAFHKLGSFKFQSKLSTWVAQIACNACLNYLQKKKLVLTDTSTGEDDKQVEALEMLQSRLDLLNDETEKKIFQKETAKILEQQIEKLSPLYKTIVILFHQEELGLAEIATITNLPIGTVKSYLFRARKILRDNILLTYKKDML